MRSLAFLAAASLTAALAFGGIAAGCGSSSSGGFSTLDGSTGGPDTSTTKEGGPAPEGGSMDAPSGSQLGAPTFTPPGPASIAAGSTVKINPGANFPTAGQIYWLATGVVPSPTTGNLYVGPIQVNQSETIIAIAHDPSHTFTDSPSASATYTVEMIDGGGLGVVGFNPSAMTENNDFLVQLSGAANATICYTLDGSTPTCDVTTAACTGGSKTYSAGTGGVSVNGTVTAAGTPPTGKITVSAIQCAVGETPSTNLGQNYQLIVADPQMTLGGKLVPVGTGALNQPWPTGAAGLAPSITTATDNSLAVSDNVAIWYTSAAANPPAPTCGSGTPITSPSLPSATATFSVNSNTTYSAIGCKQGYAQSDVVTFPFTIQENPPVLLPSASYSFAFALNETAAPNGITTQTHGVVDTANFGTAAAPAVGPSGQADWVCATNNGSDPTCGATEAVCGAAAPAQYSVPTTGVPVPVNATTVTTVVKAIACGVGVNASTEVTSSYTLQLAPPWLESNNALPAGGGVPGWDFKAALTPPGQPIATMNIPNGIVAGYGPFSAFQVGDTGGTPCTSEFPPYASPVCAGAANAPPDYYCWIKNATAACGAGTKAAPGCAAGTVNNPGGSVAYSATVTGASLGVGVTVVANDKLSVIACNGSDTAHTAMSASLPTTVLFSGAGAATAPGIPTPANPYSQQAIVTVSNGDVSASVICFTVDGSAPTCNAAGTVCTHGMCGIGGGGFDATASCGSATAADIVGAKGGANSSFTIPANDDLGGGGLLQKDGQVLTAIACNASESVSPPQTATYHFTAAQPRFTDLVGVGAGTIGDLDNGGTVGAGSCVNLSSGSNFDLAGAPGMTIAYSWTGPASCPGATAVTAGKACTLNTQCASNVCTNNLCTKTAVLFTAPPGSQPLANWSQGNALATTLGSTLCATVPATAATATLSAVTCGNTIADQLSSAPHSAQFTVVTATPQAITNQVQYAFGTACTGSDPTCGQLHTPWNNPFSVVLYDETPGSTLCYTLNGSAPACNPGGGGCASGTEAPLAANQPKTALIPFDGVTHSSGTSILALACTPGGLLPSSAPLNVAPVLQVSPIVIAPAAGTALACATANGNISVTQDASAQTLAQGGTTGGTGGTSSGVTAVTCYATDGSLPSITGACQPGAGSTTVCFNQNAGTTATVPPAATCVSGNAAWPACQMTVTGNLNSQTCVPGFQGSTASTPYTLTTYTGNINVNGTVTDWQAGEMVTTSGTNWGTGLFSYDSMSAYFGLEGGSAFVTAEGPKEAVLILIGNGAAGGAPKTPADVGGTAFTVGAGNGDANGGFQYAFEWDYGSAAVTSYTWNAGQLTWDSATLPVTVGFIAGSANVEFGVLLSAIGSPTTITSAGAIIGNYTTTPAPVSTWARGGNTLYNQYFKDVRASCLTPDQQLAK